MANCGTKPGKGSTTGSLAAIIIYWNTLKLGHAVFARREAGLEIRGLGVQSLAENASSGLLRVLTRFVQKYTQSVCPEPSDSHEAVEGSTGDTGDLGDEGYGDAELEEVTDLVLLALDADVLLEGHQGDARLAECIEDGDDLAQRSTEPGEFGDDDAVAALEAADQFVEPAALFGSLSGDGGLDEWVDVEVVLARVLENGEALAARVLLRCRNPSPHFSPAALR